jgi:2-iminobutanoate/2-iminopropanoate deaminase
MKNLLTLSIALVLFASVCFAQTKGGREVVTTKDMPQTGLPFSPAIKAGGFVFASGQLAIDPATGKMVEGDIKVQTDRVLKNLAAVLAAAGTGLDRAVKVTVFLKNLSDFQAMNEVYVKFFPTAPPARSTVQVAGLVRDALIEIDVVALQ